jgi:cellulose synthase/poly-beta-1,6-N-acetylglucosamine synthase-like glycosyltransferase
VTLLLSMLLLALAIPAVASSIYLLRLTLHSRAALPRPRSSRHLRFDVIVPAHDEAAVIASAVASLRRIDWPVDRVRVLVVADNCSDRTAELARAAGAEVLERRDRTRRGKGHALAFAFDASRRRGWADAVVVVDADSIVSPNLLEAFSQRIEAGAHAVQAHYGVLNPLTSWRTRLMAIALAAFHQVRSRGRERLGLSSGIRGNGWCITHTLLFRTSYRAFSLTEDLEFGIDLGLAGHRVEYADEAHVDAEMVSGETAARSQRQRWEHGRLQLIRTRTLPLLRRALRPGGHVCLDLALDLLVAPLSYVVLIVLALIGIGGLASLRVPALALWSWIGIGCATCLALYVLRGWQLSGIGIRGLGDLARVPMFIAWKLLLWRRPVPPEWIRTQREGP